VAKVLDRWCDSVPFDAARVIEAQPVVQKVGKLDFSVGVLVQTADEVQYYPAGGPKGPTCAESHPVPRILRRYGGLGPDSPVIAFEEGSRAYSYLPSAGVAFTQRFWDRCRAPSRIVHLDMPARRTVERVLGPARFRRVRTADGRFLELEHVYQEGMAWIGTFKTGDLLPAVGQQVSVDVGQPDGVYRFETQVMDIAAGDHESKLFLTRPKTIRVYNQRRTYRVPVDITARAHVDAQSRQLAPLLAEDSLLGPDAHRLGAVAGLDLHLSDLSLGGCAAEGSVDLPVGSTLELELDLEGHGPLRLRGRVLRADSPSAGELRRFGIRFEDLRQSTERELQRHVLAAQRRDLGTSTSGAMAAAR
jgi:c-di-GMP-binding flagellar brake protein YcgR